MQNKIRDSKPNKNSFQSSDEEQGLVGLNPILSPPCQTLLQLYCDYTAASLKVIT